jgi:hypothetical protein
MVSCSRCESFGCSGAIVALLQKRCHAPAKFGEVGEVSLAPEEFIAELLFQLFDGTRERGLCDIALLGGAREIEQARHRKEVPDLVHFHQFPRLLAKRLSCWAHHHRLGA